MSEGTSILRCAFVVDRGVSIRRCGRFSSAPCAGRKNEKTDGEHEAEALHGVLTKELAPVAPE